MKKKIFSTLACFMLCFVTLFMVAGCKDKEEVKTPVAEEQAMQMITTAATEMEEQNKFNINMSISAFNEQLMTMKMLQIDNESYTEMKVAGMLIDSMFGGNSYEADGTTSQEEVEYLKIYSWLLLGVDSKQTSYAKMETKMVGSEDIETSYLKDFALPFDEIKFDGMADTSSLGSFVEAYTKGEETYIIFQANDVENDFSSSLFTGAGSMKFTIVIKNNKLTSVKADMTFQIEGMPFTISFEVGVKCGDDVTESIPELPTLPEGTDWIPADSSNPGEGGESGSNPSTDGDAAPVPEGTESL